MMIQTENLRKCYGHTEAVSGLNLAVPEGWIYGLFGPNGVGKTTSLKMLPRQADLGIFLGAGPPLSAARPA